MAGWYDATTGVRGTPHHRKAAIPAVMRLAGVATGERLIDIGCGQGVLAHHVLKAGGSYLGVDASQTMIKLARKRREGVVFEHGDARDLSGTTSAEPATFDVAVFMLSLQDMDPLEKVMTSAAEVLKPGGRLVLFMVHPAFRPPRGSGWGYDERRKLVYRRIERYLSPAAVPMKEYAEVTGVDRGATISFHRPLQDYFAALSGAGFVVDWLDELADPLIEAGALKPGGESGPGHNSAEIPLFLAVRAVKNR